MIDVYVVTSWVVDEWSEHPSDAAVEAACRTLSGACDYVVGRCSTAGVAFMVAHMGTSAEFADAVPMNPRFFRSGTVHIGRARWRIERVELSP
ncbi:MAG: hypothetical protein V3W41_22195 [Planctomycetota bacterium]